MTFRAASKRVKTPSAPTRWASFSALDSRVFFFSKIDMWLEKEVEDMLRAGEAGVSSNRERKVHLDTRCEHDCSD